MKARFTLPMLLEAKAASAEAAATCANIGSQFGVGVIFEVPQESKALEII